MSDRTGGPAFPIPDTYYPNGQIQFGANGMTLLDWFAGQALAGLVSRLAYSGMFEDAAETAYKHAEAMLAEKSRREATGKDCSQVPDHSPDAGKMARLEEENRELVEALKSVLDCITETRGPNAFTAVADAKDILAKHQTHKKEAGHD